ncbi:hypothetical protein FACS1894200_00290 [Spirochaetia bacterium]|nr:hypothetical protein FACS1894200_00290 [Spirochaetia bacterium]
MTKIVLKYNSINEKTMLEQDGNVITGLKCIGHGDDKRLGNWKDAFFPELVQYLGLGSGSDCEIQFYGTEKDFDEIKRAYAEHKSDHYPDIDIRLSRYTEDRLTTLKNLFDDMQKNSPYHELKDPILRTLFDKAVNSEFEISVIATMSSGKSTLINALLGRELLPARNEATTAKIIRIKDVIDADDWRVRTLTYNADGVVKKESPFEYADHDKIDRLNGLDNHDVIEIVGKIPNIDSKRMQLVLSDTPGPNNSSNLEHERHINELILDDTYKPMIMYVFNAEQLETTDDNILLEKIAKAMEKSGKRNTDRFLFVLNKADALDPGKSEYVDNKIADLKTYLKRFGIRENDASIFPVSAQLAKLIRMQKANLAMSYDEEDFLSAKVKRFIGDKKRHFSEYAPLSNDCKKQQDAMEKKAQEAKDDNALALIYSGIPALELAINEYLDKYAFSAKIRQAVSIFKDSVARRSLKNKTEEELQRNIEARKKVADALEYVRKELEKGDKAEEFKTLLDEKLKGVTRSVSDKLDSIETELRVVQQKEVDRYDKQIVTQKKIASPKVISTISEKLGAKYQGFLEKYSYSESHLGEFKPVSALGGLKEGTQNFLKKLLDNRDAKKLEAQKRSEHREIMADDAKTLVMETSRRFKDIEWEMHHKLEEWMNDLLKDHADSYIREYQNCVKGLINVQQEDLKNAISNFVLPDISFNADVILEGLKGIEKAPPKKIADPRTWINLLKTGTVNADELFEKFIVPQFVELYDDIEKAKRSAQENVEKIGKYFDDQIESLNGIVKEKADEEREKLASQETIDRAINETKGHREWLANFELRLDAILNI